MDVWRDVILILAVLGIFILGFYLMAKLDKILEENRRAIEKKNESCEPTCIMLTETVTEEELVDEIRKFRSRHKEACILLYDSSGAEMTGNKLQFTREL